MSPTTQRPPGAATRAEGSRPLSESTPIIITIDGPAGTGKSTVARELASRLGLDFLDTGAMYRAATAIALDHGVDLDDPHTLVRVVADADLHFDWAADPPSLLAWNRDFDASRLRDDDVTAAVSRVASIRALREHLVRKQRLIGRQHPRLVSEGRDQGSVVFPDAAVKFFLEATPPVRARRRVDQLRAGGRDPDEAEILRDIEERDRLDSSRADGPLICPPDALRIDTSNLTLPEVVARLESHVRARVGEFA